MKTEIVKLSKTIEINGKKTKTITLREPMSGELRGLSMLEVVQLNTNAITTLAPRISELSETHMVNMGAADLLVIGGTIAGFFVPAG